MLGYRWPEVINKFHDLCRRQCRESILVRGRLLQVKDPQDLFMLQTEFIRTQMQAMAEQAKGLSETATKSMMESVKIRQRGASRPNCRRQARATWIG